MCNSIDGAEMVWVQGGTFTMGNIYDLKYSDARPAHQVTLSGYWIYKYEVTVAQYRTFCVMTGRELPLFPSGYSWKRKTSRAARSLQKHPIVNVSWHDAKAYADWAGVSLPTEAQWEYAARGPGGHNYPWGGIATASDLCNGFDFTKCANEDNSHYEGKSTWPVDSFPAGVSWCDAHDMAGNVWEWCADWFGKYRATPATNPTGPVTGERRMLRGGSWDIGSITHYRGSERDATGAPDDVCDSYGFRCVSNSPCP